jgi:hypothetical protein
MGGPLSNQHNLTIYFSTIFCTHIFAANAINKHPYEPLPIENSLSAIYNIATSNQLIIDKNV